MSMCKGGLKDLDSHLCEFKRWRHCACLEGKVYQVYVIIPAHLSHYDSLSLVMLLKLGLLAISCRVPLTDITSDPPI